MRYLVYHDLVALVHDTPVTSLMRSIPDRSITEVRESTQPRNCVHGSFLRSLSRDDQPRPYVHNDRPYCTMLFRTQRLYSEESSTLRELLFIRIG